MYNQPFCFFFPCTNISKFLKQIPGNKYNAFLWILNVITTMKNIHLISGIVSLKKEWELFFCLMVWQTKQGLNCCLITVPWFSVWTALETMLTEYCATIEMTENVDPKSALQIKPPQLGNMIFFKANVLSIRPTTQSWNITRNGIQYCDCVFEETFKKTLNPRWVQENSCGM